MRAGRSVSRVTICAPGHRIDPVQYLAYHTVKSWIRWLRQPHLDQDSTRLQRSWHRMHDVAYPAGTSSRGLIAPPLTDPTSQWTAVTVWVAILASIGWKWIAPYSLLVDDLRDITPRSRKPLIIFSDRHCATRSCGMSGLITVEAPTEEGGVRRGR